jgi:Arc/MetJ-type ribon-helix-helix transcriptional regulator
MRKSEIQTYWNVPVPKSLDRALEIAIKRDWHRTKAEFIREAVRRELERLGFKPIVSDQLDTAEHEGEVEG